MNTKKTVLMVLGILGVVTSYFVFLQWMSANEFSVIAGWKNAFETETFGQGFSNDLFFTFLIVLAVAYWDRKFLGAKKVALIYFSSIILGVSLGLALYIYFLAQAKRSPELS